MSTDTVAVDQEVALRTAAAAGDMDAFAQVYRETRERVLRFLMFRTAGNRELSEDICSATYARALANLQGWRDMGRPMIAWLITIAGNLLADHFKSYYQRTTVLVDEVNTDADAVLEPDCADLALWRVADQQRREVLAAALGRLTAHQQQIIRLRYLQGLTLAQAAAELDVDLGVIKAGTYRAVRALARDEQIQQLWQEQEQRS